MRINVILMCLETVKKKGNLFVLQSRVRGVKMEAVCDANYRNEFLVLRLLFIIETI